MLRIGKASPGKYRGVVPGVKALIFDGDDTLWVTQPLFDQAKAALAKIVNKKLGIQAGETLTRLDKIDVAKIATMGFSPQRFPTSLVETFCTLCASKGGVPSEAETQQVYALGAAIFTKPPMPVKDVKKVLSLLGQSYQLALYTMGDVAIQRRIITALQLEPFFSERISIVSEKTSLQLQKVLQARGWSPGEVLMVGNSMKSDINPALELGITCVWVHQHSWAYDSSSPLPGEVIEISQLQELPRALARRSLSRQHQREDFRPYVRV